MKIVLTQPVGKVEKEDKKSNSPSEVKMIKQAIINLKIEPEIVLNEEIDIKFINAIKKFQRLFFKGKTDGKINPRGSTISKLNYLAIGKTIVVDIASQNLYAISNLAQIYKFNCTTGDSDNPTPKGIFNIIPGRKHKDYTSKTYKVPMDYAMFFYKGCAIHRANLVSVTSILKNAGIDYFGSHGCVRLGDSDAKTMFTWTPEKTPVMIL